MTAQTLLRYAFLAGSMVLLAACSSSSELTINKAISAPVDHEESIRLVINTKLPEDADEDYRSNAAQVATRLRGELYSRLVFEGVFKQAYHVGQDNDAKYQLDVSINETDEVSQGARIFLGVFAGKNELALNVVLTDRSTNEVLTDFIVTGKSASHPLSSEDGMDDAIREAVDQIVLTLR